MGTVELLAALLFVGIVVMLGWSRASAGISAKPPPSPVARPFMTRREQAALAALEHVLPMYRIHAQVAMGALLRVPSTPCRRVTPADRNLFARKIVDFVIEDPTTGQVVALVEVDDKSHDAQKDRERDAMTQRAGYITLRVPAGAKPTVQTMIDVVGALREEAPSAAFRG